MLNKRSNNFQGVFKKYWSLINKIFLTYKNVEWNPNKHRKKQHKTKHKMEKTIIKKERKPNKIAEKEENKETKKNWWEKKGKNGNKEN